MRKQIGVKSRRLYEIGSYTGLCHYISLVWREYAYGRSIYIVKIVISTRYGKTIRKRVYDNEHAALRALRACIYEYTLFSIDSQLDLPI